MDVTGAHVLVLVDGVPVLGAQEASAPQGWVVARQVDPDPFRSRMAVTTMRVAATGESLAFITGNVIVLDSHVDPNPLGGPATQAWTPAQVIERMSQPRPEPSDVVTQFIRDCRRSLGPGYDVEVATTDRECWTGRHGDAVAKVGVVRDCRRYDVRIHDESGDLLCLRSLASLEPAEVLVRMQVAAGASVHQGCPTP